MYSIGHSGHTRYKKNCNNKFANIFNVSDDGPITPMMQLAICLYKLHRIIDNIIYAILLTEMLV